MDRKYVDITLDSRRRATLTKLGVKPGQRFLVTEKPDGTIILEPVVSVPAKDL